MKPQDTTITHAQIANDSEYHKGLSGQSEGYSFVTIAAASAIVLVGAGSIVCWWNQEYSSESSIIS